MKKRCLSILGLGCAALVMTGCGSSNKLVCTQDLSSEFGDYGKGEERLEITFNSDGTQIESATTYIDVEITKDEMLNMVDLFKSTLESNCSKDSQFSSCDVKTTKNTVSMEADMVIPEDEKEATIDETREDIESSGFTCK